jgi:GxxExxY protein
LREFGPILRGTRAAKRWRVLIHLPTNALTERIIRAGIEVHRRMGPGLLESTYRPCLAYELQNSGLDVATEVPLPLKYKELRIACAYRLDLVVNEEVVVEVKTAEKLLALHTAQLLTYLRLGNYRVGLLLNFNALILKDGIVRVINDQYNNEKS